MIVVLGALVHGVGCKDPGQPVARPAPDAAAEGPGCRQPAGIRDRQLRDRLSRAGISADQIRCNTFVRWEPSLDRYADRIVEGLAEQWNVSPDTTARKRAHHHALGYLVRTYYDQARPHNLGATLIEGHSYQDSSGRRRPLVLFRSALTSTPDGSSRCFESLVRHGGVRHVVNLYGGTFPFQDMIEAEQKQARALGVTFLDAGGRPELAYRELVEHEKDYRHNLAEAMVRLARLIRQHLLRPGGKPPRGNLYVHCCGGMHRSGMLNGVIRRCINGDPMDRIEAEYRQHTDWRSDEEPGGFEALNLRFIQDFDCGLLQSSR